jgi:general secretion pathway protein B
MSYILDALRKAEAERERGQLPGLHSAVAMPRLPERRLLERVPKGWPVLGGLAALALVGGLGGWVWLQRGPVEPSLAVPPVTGPGLDIATAEPQATAPRRAPNPAPAKTPRPDLAPAPTGSATARPSTAAGQPQPVIASVGAAVVPTPKAAAPAAPSTPIAGPKDTNRSAIVTLPVAASAQPLVASSPTASALATPVVSGPANVPPTAPMPTVSSAPPLDGRIHAVDDLPADIRRELPKLDFGGLVQLDNPPRRSLIVNGAILMEGELVQPNLVLEQIRLTGAVLRYKGWRYQLPL